jgi:hypothetical protein
MCTCFQPRGFIYSVVSLIAFLQQVPCLEADQPTSPETGLYGVSPYTALREAIALLPAKDQKQVSPAELEIYRKVANGEAKNVSAFEAVLTIDGVTDEAKRQHYRDRLDEIVTEARDRIADAKTQNEKLTVLAKYLYDGPCHAGYTDNQVNVCRLLDRGDFNCVSASILYNLVATRLGFRTRCVEVPGHIALRVGDFYIEPVCGGTCTAAEHQKIVDEQIMPNAPAHVLHLYNNKGHMYVCGNLGLNAEPYVTRASQSEQAGRIDLALIRDLQAASLDNKNPLYKFCTEILLKRWFTNELKAHQFARAQKIAAIYGQLFGDDSNDLFAQVAAARAAKPIKG